MKNKKWEVRKSGGAICSAGGSRTEALINSIGKGYTADYIATWIDSDKDASPVGTSTVRRVKETPTRGEVLQRARRFLLNIAKLTDGDMNRVAKEIITEIDEVL